jgi:fatty-acyl-CoA synthase
LPRPDSDTPALLVYTSGTTGRPKGAVHTQGGLWWNAMASIAMHDLTADDRVLTVLPLFHVGGLCIQTVPALYAGASISLHPRFDPGAWLDAVALHAPTISLMVPATMRAVIEHPRWGATDLRSLRILGAGSSTIPDALIEAFHARGVPVCQIYGATETGPVSIVLRAGEAMAHAGAAGRPALGCEIRLVGSDGSGVNDGPAGGVGEILVKGPNVMRGYWRDPANPAFAEGWFRTGDLARRDADGYYTVVGRAQDLIISGGENIYPAEIENLLAGVPEIAEAAVIGMPDPHWGEVPVAVVVLRAGATLGERVIRAYFDGRLARFKHPRRIVFRATLPRNAMGKVVKRVLVEESTSG